MKSLLLCLTVFVSLHAQTIPPAQGTPLYAPLALKTQTQRQRFMDYAIVTFGPRAVVAPAVSAAIRMAHPPALYPRDWKDGGEAFGRIYGSDLANRAAKETGRYAAAAILHEDFRYRPSGSKDPLARVFHALAFTVVDRSDSGQNRLAVANLVAAGAGGFAGQLYMPTGFNNLSHAETRTAVAFGGFAAQNLLREFSPELGKVSKKLKVPYLDLPIPEWWVKLDKR
jgi:hypothetical protein